MSTENIEKICKYKEELKQQLEALEAERKTLLDKVKNGENLSKKELKRNQELVSLIKEVRDELEAFNALESLDEMSNSLNKISETKTTKAEKDKLIKKLLTQFKKFNVTSKENLKNLTGLTDKELKNLDKTKSDINEEINELKAELRVAKRKNYDTSDIEEEIKDKEYILELIKNFETGLLDITKIEEDLKKLANSKTSKDDKMVIIITYNNIINQYKEDYIKEIEATLNLENDDEPTKDQKSFKERTKEKLANISSKFKENRKKIIAIGGSVVLVACIAAAAIAISKNIKSNSNNNNNNNNSNDLDNQSTIEQTYEDADKAIITALTNKGYNEYFAMLMAKNFSNETIEALKAVPYIEAVENYATISEFNIDYINDYENARTIYNITSEKAVDYVNRSYEIQKTGFYNDATINDIVAIVKAIDEQDLFIAENGALEHSINATLTEIYNNYAFTTNSSKEDAKKLEAFKYFAKEGTDLNRFLTEFATLTQNVLNAKTDAEKSEIAKQAVYTYLDTFANTFAGNSFDIENPNENAIITDTYDWNIAYSSFIKPLMSMYITEKNVDEFICLQINMLSNYEQWAQVNGCALEQESRTLGGEQ